MADQPQTFDFPEFNMSDLEEFQVDEFPAELIREFTPAMIAEMEAAGRSLIQSLKPYPPRLEESDDE